MDLLRQYILSIISATIVTTIILSLIEKQSIIYEIIKFISGVFLIITLISPLRNKPFIDISDMLHNIESDSSLYVQEGNEYALQMKEQFIKDSVTAYVLDRAKEMNIEIEVDVDIQENLSGPEKIYISGNISPYKKEQMESMIESDLGLTKEFQIWR